MHKITRTDTASSVVGLSNVHKSFGALKVLNGVSFEVNRGEVLVLIGRSGSGKSTALRCIDRFETIDSGEIVVCGHRVSDPKLDLRALRQDVGIVFQSYNLFPHLTIEENITLAPCSVKGIAKAQAKEQARRVLAQVGLEDKLHQYPEQLSGGQQQRAAIARALVQQAELVLADEPVASLDPVSARRVMETLADLNASDGLTVVVTLHQVDYALRYCRRVVALKAGRIVYDGTPAGLDRARLTEIYGPEFEDVFWEGPPA
jgi:polar amino acid transport system ATP-binding protein